MRHHLDNIRYLMASTGEGFLIPLTILFVLLGVSWIGAVALWGIQ